MFQLINRSLVLAQHTLILCFYRKSDGHHTLWFDTLLDRLLQPEFDRLIAGHHGSSSRSGKTQLHLTQEHAAKHLHRLVSDDFGFTVWIADMSGPQLQATAVPTTDHPIGQLFTSLIASFWQAPVRTGVETNDLLQSLRTNVDTITAALQRHAAPPIPAVLTAVTEKHLTHHKRGLSAIFEDVYARFSQSPLLNSKDAPLPNLSFFVKTFDRSTPPFRCGAYAFNATCIVPKPQEVAILSAFADKSIRQRLIRAQTGHLDYRDAESEFAKLLNGTSDDHNKIIAALRSPCSVNERMVTEYTLSSGIMNFRKNPLDPGRLNRIYSVEAPEGADAKKQSDHAQFIADETKRARFHATCLRNMFLLMLPIKQNVANLKGQLSLAQMAVRVGGGPFASIIHLRQQDNVEDDLVDDTAFYKTYHFYQSIGVEAISRIRSRSKWWYYASAADILAWHLREAEAATRLASEPPVKLRALLTTINAALDDLTRVYPYAKIVLAKTAPASVERKDVSGPIQLLGNPDLKVVAYIEDNPYFDHFGTERFIKIADVERFLADRGAVIQQGGLTDAT